MKPLFNILILAIMLPAMVFAGPEKFKGKYTKEKTLKKEYSVNAGANLKIDNNYGNIDIVTWNENRTVIEVHIKTNGDDEKKVQEKLDQINVEFSGNASQVNALTTFNERKSNWSWFGNNSNNVSMEINYTIKLPVTNSVDLNNDYGAIGINSLEGDAKINCDYGQLIIGELLGSNNMLSFNYTDKSTIGYIKNGTINADYSGFTLEKSDQLNLTADYTRSEINDVKSIKYNCDYGKLTVEKVKDIAGTGDYLTTRIGAAMGNVNMNSDYGNITIDKLTSSVKSTAIQGNYTQIKVGFENSFNFTFSVNTSYSSFKGEDTVTVTKSSKDGSDKMYSGYHGSQNSGNSISINSNYGGVTFIKL